MPIMTDMTETAADMSDTIGDGMTIVIATGVTRDRAGETGTEIRD
jgi:hypothetical protein